MDGLDQIPSQYQPIAGMVFAIIVAVGSAIVFLRGRREGAPKPKVQEFYAAGQLADMGPVKELVEQTGLLVQQQVRTNMHLEAVAVALKNAATLYEGQLEAQATQEEVEARAQQLFERRLAEERPPRRRPARRKPSTPKGTQ